MLLLVPAPPWQWLKNWVAAGSALTAASWRSTPSRNACLICRSEIGNKGKPLKPKPFTVCNAGLYDFARLKELPWDGWRSYALGIFQCQDAPHKVAGIELDGYRNGDDVLVFNYRQGERRGVGLRLH